MSNELMSQIDADRVTDAYILLDYDFSHDNFLSSLIEKYEAVPRLRKVIKKTCSYFARLTPNDDTVPHTIFIISSCNGATKHQLHLRTLVNMDTTYIKPTDINSSFVLY